ncbi:hypothetical protein [Pseudolactococcus paracarnosus]|uniref:Uncharacterized protein n=1 Tax=Pseudolactococcus paracarnosus TaxID=2749962 RepID=A0ABT0AMJ2_9LACT|nr:hypothetical protein [Lactococcus paracarnosus]MCJ1977760.1 hypothetical protein [Lactococcus paracarnosus]MCJ1983927.1 hypothetical protein [Lactococcus paracarnosus]MCJ1998605.1 hypothetical protein [Lactococcus paracarnosus]
MLDVLDKALKELQKNLEKINVMQLAVDTNGAKTESKKRVKQQVAAEKEMTKTALTSAKKNLGNAIQGKFGKKIDAVLEKQGKLIDHL